jgi:hypothetical protein
VYIAAEFVGERPASPCRYRMRVVRGRHCQHTAPRIRWRELHFLHVKERLSAETALQPAKSTVVFGDSSSQDVYRRKQLQYLQFGPPMSRTSAK